MSIYTKKGDRGETGLLGGRRLSKTDAIFEFLGSLDETNSALAIVLSDDSSAEQSTDRKKSPCVKKAWRELVQLLSKVQGDLLLIGSTVASPTIPDRLDDLTKQVSQMEASIDCWDKILPPLSNFIIPGGTQAAAALHLARAISRRAERAYHRLGSRDDSIAQYLNRLSDLLFQCARAANFIGKRPDDIWRK